MPFSIDPEFEQALKGTIRLSKALRIERRDGAVFGFTDAGRDVLLPAKTWGNITVPQTPYASGNSQFPTDIQQDRDPRKIDNWEFIAYTDTAEVAVTDESFIRRAWVGASYSLIIFARENLTWQMLRQRGRLGAGSLDLNKGAIKWKMNGLSKLLDQEVIDVTSPTSRAVWGDPELSFFDLTGLTADGFPARVTGTVTAVNGVRPRRVFTFADAIGQPTGRFSDGTITFLSGANSGVVASVLDYDRLSGIFMLDDEAPSPIAVGDTIRAQVHVPVTIEEWKLFFGTGMYFAGEPGIPNSTTANVISSA